MSYSATVLADTPTAYYRLGDLTDSSGNTLTLTSAGTVAPAATAGILAADSAAGAARAFLDNGTMSLRRAHNALLHLTSAFTVEAWWKINSGVIGAERRAVNKGNCYRLMLTDTGKPRIRFDTQDGFFELNGTTTMAEGTVYHVVGKLSSGTARIYVNGVQEASMPVTGIPTVTTQDLIVGADIGAAPGWAGVLDEIALYQSALSDARILAHYNAGITPPPVNTVAPALSGAAEDGAGVTMTVSDGTWVATPTPTFTYQWKRNGADIVGATASSYVIQAADVATLLKCTVTATNTAGVVSADSNTVVPGAPRPSAFIKYQGQLVPSAPRVRLGGVTYPPVLS